MHKMGRFFWKIIDILSYVLPFKLMVWIYIKIGSTGIYTIKIKNEDEFEKMEFVYTYNGYCVSMTKKLEARLERKARMKKLKKLNDELRSLENKDEVHY
jgi:hypothetical protein